MLQSLRITNRGDHMKRTIFVMMLLLALLFAACSKDKTPTVPDFSQTGFIPTGDYLLMLDSYKLPESGYHQIGVLQAKQPVSTITINGDTYELDYDDLDEETGYHHHFLYELFENPENQVAPNKMFNYSFQMDGKNYSGSIRVPSEPSVVFPAFDFDTDYTLSWNSAKKPHFYMIDYLFRDDLGELPDYEDLVQLDNTAQKYTISKSGWQSFVREGLYYRVNHGAMNYLKKDDNLAIFIYSHSNYHHGPQEKGTIMPYSKAELKQKCKQLFQQIQSGKIILN